MEQNNRQTKDVYSIVTDTIIEQLGKGIAPWRKPWTEAGLPRNLITGKPYRGINLILLAMCGYPRNYFLTFQQLKQLGGSVKKNEKAHLILFWQWEKKDQITDTAATPFTEETVKSRENAKPVLRYYSVFNIGQCTGIPEAFISSITQPNQPLLACEKVLGEMPDAPIVQHIEHSAYYHPAKDIINMPKMDTFVSSETYYATLFHELIHSTGHTRRLNRKELMGKDAFGSEGYSIEELTAEIGASYLASYTGIALDDFASNTAYISSWLDVLKKDKRFIIYAAAQAQRSVEYILNHTEETAAPTGKVMV